MTTDVMIRQVDYGTEEYRRTLELRKRLAGKSFSVINQSYQRRNESRDVHIAAARWGQEVAALLFSLGRGGAARLRLLVMEDSFREEDLEEQMLYFAEQAALFQGASRMEAEILPEAVDRYRLAGYLPETEDRPGSRGVWVRKELY